MRYGTDCLKSYAYNLNNALRIQNVTQPLFEYFGFYLFTYRRIYDEEKIYHICSKPEWIENCFTKELWVSQQMSNRLKNLPLFQSQNFIWIHDLSDPLYINLREHNIWNGITVYRRYENFTELVGFASTRDNANIINFYQSNPSIINHFIFYFKEQVQDLLKECDKFLFSLNPPGRQTAIEDNNIQQFINATKVKRYYINSNFNAYMTPREVDTLKLLSQGKTIKEAARILDLSPRTLEDYLKNIKHRFENYTKAELFRAVKDL